jgi:putative transposase
LVAERSPRFEGKIKWDKRVGSFHLIYLYELPRLVDPDPAFDHKRIVATDPGVYPFQAWYSPTSAEYGRLLEGETDKLMQRCIAIDKRQSRLDQFQGGRTRHKRQRYRTRKRFRRRLARERNRLRGWVQAAHYNCANLLLNKHDLVLQPLLETARLSRRVSRRIQKDTVRKMLTWSHSLFVQRLEAKASCYPGRHVIRCKEPGTSKTCTHCGYWKANLRVSDKDFVCPRCHLIIDRQLAGARNNFFAAYGMAAGVGWDEVDG